MATDVCMALEISNPTVALERLDNDERSKFNLGRQGFTNIVNESGLYSPVQGDSVSPRLIRRRGHLGIAWTMFGSTGPE